jgi:hypothetical protein
VQHVLKPTANPRHADLRDVGSGWSGSPGPYKPPSS